MKIIKVKVFDAYKVNDIREKYYKETYNLDDLYMFEYHNQIVDENGFVSPKDTFSHLKPIKPLPEDIIETNKYELMETEQKTLKLLRQHTIEAEKKYKECKDKEEEYERKLIKSLHKVVDFFEGEYWDCNLSPLGRCLYTEDDCGEPTCIFCGEPEERK